MADQAPSDVVPVAGEAQPTLAATASSIHHGRPISWAAVTIVTVGFVAGGLGLVLGPTWWLFWVGAGLVAAGGIVALGCGIFDDWY